MGEFVGSFEEFVLASGHRNSPKLDHLEDYETFARSTFLPKRSVMTDTYSAKRNISREFEIRLAFLVRGEASQSCAMYITNF